MPNTEDTIITVDHTKTTEGHECMVLYLPIVNTSTTLGGAMVLQEQSIREAFAALIRHSGPETPLTRIHRWFEREIERWVC